MNDFWDWIWEGNAPVWVGVVVIGSMMAGCAAAIGIVISLCVSLNSIMPLVASLAAGWFMVYRKYVKSKETNQ